jgi:sodium/bile acid cotransporter 7
VEIRGDGVAVRSSILRLLRAQWFSLSLVGLFAFAWAAPGVGGALNPDDFGLHLAVAVTFFLTGTALRWRESAAALTAWRIHLFIQGTCYVVLPAAIWLAVLPFRGSLPEGLVIGLYCLSLLPTTIASNVVFTQLTGGNVAAAVCNAVGGNVAGVFVCPWILTLMIGGAYAIRIPVAEVLMKLGVTVIVPLLGGCAVGWWKPDGTGRRRERVSFWSAVLVLAIVWFAFCDLFANPEALSHGTALAPVLALIVPGHFALLWAIGTAGRLMGYPREDRIAMLFCGSQKTLSLGLPMIAACLATRPELIGLASLPIIVYHPTQLITAGFVKDWLNGKTDRNR